MVYDMDDKGILDAIQCYWISIYLRKLLSNEQPLYICICICYTLDCPSIFHCSWVKHCGKIRTIVSLHVPVYIDRKIYLFVIKWIVRTENQESTYILWNTNIIKSKHSKNVIIISHMSFKYRRSRLGISLRKVDVYLDTVIANVRMQKVSLPY